MKRIRQNYHWIIVFLAFSEMVVFGGLHNSANVFLIPIAGDLDVSRGSYAIAISTYNIFGTIATLLSGIIFEKLGYKRSLVAGLSLSVISLLLTATSSSLVGICLSKVLLGLSYGVCFTAGAVRIVKDWFCKHQGLLIGAISMATGLGGSIMTLLLEKSISGYGWRISHVLLALAFGVIILAYLFFVKNHPADIGLTPYGSGTAMEDARKNSKADQSWSGLPFCEWLHRPLLYMMILSTLVSCISMGLSSTVMMPHFQGQGFSPEIAARYQSAYMLVLAGAKVACGLASDKLGPRPVSIFCLGCGAVGQGLLSSATDPLLCYLGTALCGIGLCMTSVMIPLLVVSVFGSQGSSNITSIALAMSSLADIICNPASNLCFDRVGTYIPVYWTAALLNGCMILVYLIIFARASTLRMQSISNSH